MSENGDASVESYREKREIVYRSFWETTTEQLANKWKSGEASKIKENVQHAQEDLEVLFKRTLLDPSVTEWRPMNTFSVGGVSVWMVTDRNGLFVDHGQHPPPRYNPPQIEGIYIDKLNIYPAQLNNNAVPFTEYLALGARTHAAQKRIAEKFGYSTGKDAFGGMPATNNREIVRSIFNQLRGRTSSDRHLILPNLITQALMQNPLGTHPLIRENLLYYFSHNGISSDTMQTAINERISTRLDARIRLLESMPASTHQDEEDLADVITSILYPSAGNSLHPWRDIRNHEFPILATKGEHIYFRVPEPSIGVLSDIASDVALCFGFTPEAALTPAKTMTEDIFNLTENGTILSIRS